MSLEKIIKGWIKEEVTRQINDACQCDGCSDIEQAEEMTPEVLKSFASKLDAKILVGHITTLNNLKLTDHVDIDEILYHNPPSEEESGPYNATLVAAAIEFMNAMEDIDDQYKIDSVAEDVIDYYEKVMDWYLANGEDNE